MGEWRGEIRRTWNAYWLSNRMVEEKIEMPNWSSRAGFDCAEGSHLSPFFPERFEDVSMDLKMFLFEVFVWIILKTR